MNETVADAGNSDSAPNDDNNTSSSSSSSRPPSIVRYAIRSAFGKFINIDENIELVVKDRVAKDAGIKADRDGTQLTEREKSFDIHEVAGTGGQLCIRGPDDYYLQVEPPIDAAAGGAPAKAADIAAAMKLKLIRHTQWREALSANPSLIATSPPAALFQPLPAMCFTPIWGDERSPLSLQGKFAIKTAHGKYLCAEPNSSGSKLIANRLHVSLWEKFILHSTSLTTVAIQSSIHQTFITFDKSDKNKLVNAAGVIPAPNSPNVQSAAVAAAVAAIASPPAAPAVSAPAAAPASFASTLPLTYKYDVIELDKAAGHYAFRSSATGKYLVAQGNHTLTASGTDCTPWCIFQLEPI